MRKSVAGLSSRDLLMRVAIFLVLSITIVSAVSDPLAQFAAVEADEVGETVVALTPDLDSGEAIVPQVAATIPDFRFDDLRAARQASSHDWRVPSAFEARGPPV